LNEKIQWRKLYDRNPVYTLCADKYRVREYVRERVGEACLVPLLVVASDPHEVDFSRLPDRFVLKANHGCGWNEFVWSRERLDERASVARMDRWLRSNFYRRHREWQYKHIAPLILIEELLTDRHGALPVEYRFFCFDGAPATVRTARRPSVRRREW
jgi:hypothetical protein